MPFVNLRSIAQSAKEMRLPGASINAQSLFVVLVLFWLWPGIKTWIGTRPGLEGETSRQVEQDFFPELTVPLLSAVGIHGIHRAEIDRGLYELEVKGLAILKARSRLVEIDVSKRMLTSVMSPLAADLRGIPAMADSGEEPAGDNRVDAYREDKGLHRNMRQRDLAEALGVSPTGLCQIFAGVNQPSASTALAMIRFLEEQKNMKTTTFIDPRTKPRPTASNPGSKTLTEARDRIAVLEAQLRGSGTAPKPAAPASPTAKAQPVGDPGADPTYPPTRTPGGDRPNPVPMPVNIPAVKKAALSEAAVSPVLCQRELDVADFETVLSMLDNAAAHTPMQQSVIYAEVKKRRALVANRFQ
jgi:DNA-binding XRE family transcriptional regulator